MTEPGPAWRYRFGSFEVDVSTGELRRQGVRVRLNAQPLQVLVMLLQRPGELLTREEISRELWPEGTFVDAEHGVNSAINRIREALRDSASHPRFVETLARRGYRFVAPVERIAPTTSVSAYPSAPPGPATRPVPEQLNEDRSPGSLAPKVKPRLRILTTPEDLPRSSYQVVQTLFILLQIMYLSFYIGALANLGEIGDLFSALPGSSAILAVLIVTAAVLIPVRVFLLAAAIFHAPGLREKFRRIWPFLLLLDELWALSPFLLLHHISFGLALACTALLVYSPFAQRSLILMGAGGIASNPSSPITGT